LRAHRNAAGIGAGQLVDGHRSRLATSPDSPGMGGQASSAMAPEAAGAEVHSAKVNRSRREVRAGTAG